jgi:hypothetical protein
MYSTLHLKLLGLSFLIFNSYGISVDCPNVIDLARGVHLDIQQPARFSELQGDCCLASTIGCTSQRVDIVNWGSMYLDGTINATALPSALTILDMNSNSISGRFPISLPSTLQQLILHDNQLTGSLPSALPSGLTSIHIDTNYLTGDLPPIPPSVTYFVIGWAGYPANHFSGGITLNRPSDVSIYNSLITDIVIQDTSNLGVCDLSNNPLLGNPHISALTMCTKNGLYSASSLPKI